MYKALVGALLSIVYHGVQDCLDPFIDAIVIIINICEFIRFQILMLVVLGATKSPTQEAKVQPHLPQ